MKMKNTLTVLFLTVGIYSALFSQEANTPPKTKLEAFNGSTGAVIIKGFSTVATINGVGKIEIDVREFINASTKTTQYGICIEAKEFSRLERSHTSFIDFDEIDSLIAGIDYIKNINGNVTKLDNFEAVYRTKGDFSITVFNHEGTIKVAVQSGRISSVTVYLAAQNLEVMKNAIVGAKNKIEELKTKK